MEKYLISTNLAVIFAATMYSEILKPHIKDDTSNIWSWVFTFIFLILIFGSLIGSSIYFRLWRKLYESFKAMRENKRRASLVQIGHRNSADADVSIDECSLLTAGLLPEDKKG